MKKKYSFIGLIITILITGIIILSNALYSPDQYIKDKINQKAAKPMTDIHILAIDEKTMAEYGDMTFWDRSVYGDLVSYLCADSTKQPAVIGFDVMFVSEKSETEDNAFAQSCKQAGNVVAAINLVYKDKLTVSDKGIEVDSNNIALVEYPYAALRDETEYGFATVAQDADGYIRHAVNEADYEGEGIYSFAYKVAENYAKNKSASIDFPYDNKSYYGFTFTGRSGEYEIISLCDVLDEKIPASYFKDGIVLVGAYAPGMQDSYNVACQRGRQMYGVEINANLIQALLQGKVNHSVSTYVYLIFSTIIVIAFFILCRCTNIIVGTVALFLLTGGEIIANNVLYKKGLDTPFIYLPLMEILIYAYFLVGGYLIERIRRKKVLSVFQKYVAPQVVDKLSKSGEFEVKLGGEKREVAVLFVDIRGFTTMSEQLDPEEVMEILNEYLHLTTHSILDNGGTLDKFIGDATMAVFNAPFDLEDYEFKAIKAAIAMREGSLELEKKLSEKFGKSVSFGIGVHCGKAIVGNVGCDFRMDYTAIGDTVNTAARLESNAGKNQILISEMVYNRLSDRINVTEVGPMKFKGKLNEMLVYEVESIR